MDRPPVRPFFLFAGTFALLVLLRWIFASKAANAGFLVRATVIAAEPLALLVLTARLCMQRSRIQWSITEILAISAAIMPGMYVSTHANWPFTVSRGLLVVWCFGYQISGAAYVWARAHASRVTDTPLIAAGITIGAWANLAIGTMITAMVFAAK